MTESEYTELYKHVMAIETYLQSHRCRAWIRSNIWAKLLCDVRDLRDCLYRVKMAEDNRGKTP